MNGMTMPPPMHDLGGWAIVAAGAVATIWSFIAAIYCTIRPGETQADHPKRMILRKDR
ncbi:MAG: hypothetical protein ACXVAM_14355 [Vulcanimicrobiaceae bacterium]